VIPITNTSNINVNDVVTGTNVATASKVLSISPNTSITLSRTPTGSVSGNLTFSFPQTVIGNFDEPPYMIVDVGDLTHEITFFAGVGNRSWIDHVEFCISGNYAEVYGQTINGRTGDIGYSIVPKNGGASDGNYTLEAFAIPVQGVELHMTLPITLNNGGGISRPIYYMNPVGNDACNGTSRSLGTSGNCAWRSPEKAMQAAATTAAPIIYAAAGTYYSFNGFGPQHNTYLITFEQDPNNASGTSAVFSTQIRTGFYFKADIVLMNGINFDTSRISDWNCGATLCMISNANATDKYGGVGPTDSANPTIPFWYSATDQGSEGFSQVNYPGTPSIGGMSESVVSGISIPAQATFLRNVTNLTGWDQIFMNTVQTKNFALFNYNSTQPVQYYGRLHNDPFVTVTGVSCAVYSATISGTSMNVTAVTQGTLAVGQPVTGPGMNVANKIASFGTGSGGIGTYNLSFSNTLSGTQTLGECTYTFAGTGTAYVVVGGGTNGQPVAGNALSIVFTSSALSGSPITMTYTVQSSDAEFTTVAINFAACINGTTVPGCTPNSTITAAGITAAAGGIIGLPVQSAGSRITITQPQSLSPQVTYSVSGSTTTLTLTMALISGDTALQDVYLQFLSPSAAAGTTLQPCQAAPAGTCYPNATVNNSPWTVTTGISPIAGIGDTARFGVDEHPDADQDVGPLSATTACAPASATGNKTFQRYKTVGTNTQLVLMTPGNIAAPSTMNTSGLTMNMDTYTVSSVAGQVITLSNSTTTFAPSFPATQQLYVITGALAGQNFTVTAMNSASHTITVTGTISSLANGDTVQLGHNLAIGCNVGITSSGSAQRYNYQQVTAIPNGYTATMDGDFGGNQSAGTTYAAAGTQANVLFADSIIMTNTGCTPENTPTCIGGTGTGQFTAGAQQHLVFVQNYFWNGGLWFRSTPGSGGDSAFGMFGSAFFDNVFGSCYNSGTNNCAFQDSMQTDNAAGLVNGQLPGLNADNNWYYRTSANTVLGTCDGLSDCSGTFTLSSGCSTTGSSLGALTTCTGNFKPTGLTLTATGNRANGQPLVPYNYDGTGRPSGHLVGAQ
jgi:hypothetical protein